MPSALRVHLALITVSVLFGAHFVFTKKIVAAVPPRSWVLFRIGAAMLVLVPLAIALRRQKGLPSARTFAALFVASFFGVTLNQVLFTEGIVLTVPEHSAVVNAAIPTWTLLVAALAGQERIEGRRVLAIASALGGVLYLLGLDRMLLGDGAGFSTDTLVGDLLTAANGVAFAVHLVMMRRVARSLDPWTTTAVLFVQGTLLIGLYSGPTLATQDWVAAATPPVLWFTLYTVLCSTVLTYLLNTWALRHTNSSNVALYINVQPIVAAALSCAMGAPAPDHRFYVALALVSLGLWLQTRRPRGNG